MENMDKYRDLFVEESKDRLEELDSLILTLEKNPEKKSIIKDMFRTAHTFKGMAATMSYNDLTNMTHQMESLMSVIENGNHAVDETFISLMFDCRDVLESAIEDIEDQDSNNKVDFSDIQKQLEEYIMKLSSVKTEETSQEIIEASDAIHPISEDASNSQLDVDILDDYQEDLDLTDEDKVRIQTILADPNQVLHLIKIHLHPNTEMKYARAYLCIKKVKDFGLILKRFFQSILNEKDHFLNNRWRNYRVGKK